jgi:hypothetical protein
VGDVAGIEGEEEEEEGWVGKDRPQKKKESHVRNESFEREQTQLHTR